MGAERAWSCESKELTCDDGFAVAIGSTRQYKHFLALAVCTPLHPSASDEERSQTVKMREGRLFRCYGNALQWVFDVPGAW